MEVTRFRESHLSSSVRYGILAATAVALPSWTLAAPQGGQVVAGSAAIAQQGTKTTITQSTAKGAINWQSFSVGTSEYVQFVQPGTTSVTLNRVVGNDPSQLLGQMSANGQIFLVNPNGVYFGPNAVIDVAGLLATTFDISNDDFMAGRYTFARVEGRDPAAVVNDGTITADGGYVILAGDGVANHGLIEARLGDIVMASGQQVTLDLGGDGLISFAIDGEALTEIAGVENTGELYADGGRIFLTAKVQGDLLPTAVNHEGLIQARTVEEKGGIVYLGGSGGDVMIAGDIDVDAGTASADGGRILVASTNDITVSDGTELSAQGGGSGDGGTIRLIAKEVLDVEANATITTEGGATGQGGFVEVSGHSGLNIAGDVTPGSGGQMVIDPSRLVIQAGSISGSSVLYNPSGSETTVYEAYIEGKLNANTNVVLVASNSIGTGGFTGGGGITATGTGDLELRIGTTAPDTGAGSLQSVFFDSGPACAIGVCERGTTGGSYTFTQGTGGNIDLRINVDINGDLVLQPGTTGYVDARSLRAKSILIDGAVQAIDTIGNWVYLNLYAENGDVDLNGPIEIRNNQAEAYLDVYGETINISGDITVAGSWGDASFTGLKAVNVLGTDTLISVQGNGGTPSAFATYANLRLYAGSTNTDAVAMSLLVEGDLEAIADGIGTNYAQVNLKNYTGITSIDPGASLIARAGDYASSVATTLNANAYVQVENDSGSIFVNGDLSAQARGASNGYAVTSVRDYESFYGTSGASGKIVIANGATLIANGIGGSGNVNLYGDGFVIGGTLIASGDSRATINITEENYGVANDTTIHDTAQISTWSEFGQAQINLSNYTSSMAQPVPMTIDGTIEAIGTQANITFQNYGVLNINGNVHAQALGTPSSVGYSRINMYGYGDMLNVSGNVVADGGNAFIQLWNGTGSNTIKVTGNIRAEGSTHAQLYFYDYYGGGADDILIENSATLQAVSSLGAAYISFYDYTSTGELPGSLILDGQIESTGASNATISIVHDGQLEMRTDLVAEALGTPSGAGSANVSINGRGGTTNISGNVLARGNNAYINAYHGTGSASGAMNITGNLIAEGDQYANIYIQDYYGDGNVTNISDTATLRARSDLGSAYIQFYEYTSSGFAPGTMNIDGTIEALGATHSRITLSNYGTLNVNTDLLSQAAGNSINSGDAYIYLYNYGGTQNISGNLVARGGYAQVYTYTGTGDANLNLTGNLLADGRNYAQVYFYDYYAGSNNILIDGSANIQARSDLGTAYIYFYDYASSASVPDVLTIDGTISAIGSTYGQVYITNDGPLTINGDLHATATNPSYAGSNIVRLYGYRDGDITVNGQVTANNINVQNQQGGIYLANVDTSFASLRTLGGGDIYLSNTRNLDLTANAVAGDISIVSGGDIRVMTGNSAVSGFLKLSASGSITTSNFATIDAGALTLIAGDSIDLANATTIVHNGIDSSTLVGDSAMLNAYASYGGAVPASPYANAVFIAPNEVRLGDTEFYGDYMYLKSDLLTLSSHIHTYEPGTEGQATPPVNLDVVIQMQPFTSTQSIGIEQDMPISPLPGTMYYTNTGHFSHFLGTTLFVGGAGYGGPVDIGQNGTIDIGNQNFLVASTAPITGAGNILTSGLSNVAGTLAPPSPTPTPTSAPVNTGSVNTVVQQTTTTTTSPTETAPTTITEETVEANVPSEEQVAETTPSEEETATGAVTEEEEQTTEPLPDDPIDMVAALEKQPLVDAQLEVNGTVLTCQ